MIKKADIDRLIAVNAQLQEILTPPPGNPLMDFVRRATTSPGRTAASLLCEELGRVVHYNGDYWQGLRDASSALNSFREQEREWYGNIIRLLSHEEAAFHRLGIEEEKYTLILRLIYAEIQRVMTSPNPTPAELEVLRGHLNSLAERACEASAGPVKKVYETIIAHKGASIMAGLATAGVNVWLSTQSPDSGGFAWASLKLGYSIARGNVDELGNFFDQIKGDSA